MTKIFQLNNISKNFTNNIKDIIIDNINLDIHQNQIISLIGPSGSGKTTLLQIIGLLDNPSSGDIIFKNKNITNVSQKEINNIRKNDIGFIFQYHHLISEFNVIDNVALPLLINKYSKKHAYQLAKETLKEVDMIDKINSMPAQLSGGQKQRVAIARAIINKPTLILADEPTGNLDSNLSYKIFDLIHKLVNQYKLSCVFVTHNEKLAHKCDIIYKIENKKLEKSN